MAKLSTANLKPNPFTTYRDLQTGRWLVIPSPSECAPSVARSPQPSPPNEASPFQTWNTGQNSAGLNIQNA